MSFFFGFFLSAVPMRCVHYPVGDRSGIVSFQAMSVRIK
jgi:hypothetical protein